MKPSYFPSEATAVAAVAEFTEAAEAEPLPRPINLAIGFQVSDGS